MDIVKSVAVPGAVVDGAVIELAFGDLSKLGPGDPFDILLCSAFPNDYAAVRNTLIGDLSKNAGVSVSKLAREMDPADDLRASFKCWLSRPIDGRAGFRRLLVFEHTGSFGREDDSRYAVVGGVFRAIIAAAPDATTIAMPILSSGNVGERKEVMLRALVNKSAFWMRNGLSVKRVTICAYSPGRKVDTSIASTFNDAIREVIKPPHAMAMLKGKMPGSKAGRPSLKKTKARPEKAAPFADELLQKTGQLRSSGGKSGSAPVPPSRASLLADIAAGKRPEGRPGGAGAPPPPAPAALPPPKPSRAGRAKHDARVSEEHDLADKQSGPSHFGRIQSTISSLLGRGGAADHASIGTSAPAIKEEEKEEGRARARKKKAQRRREESHSGDDDAFPSEARLPSAPGGGGLARPPRPPPPRERRNSDDEFYVDDDDDEEESEELAELAKVADMDTEGDDEDFGATDALSASELDSRASLDDDDDDSVLVEGGEDEGPTVDVLIAAAVHEAADAAAKDAVIQLLRLDKPDVVVNDLLGAYADLVADQPTASAASLSEAVAALVRNARIVVPLLTPAFLLDELCTEAFSHAFLISRSSAGSRRASSEARGDFSLEPLYVDDAPLPRFMQAVQYHDVRAIGGAPTGLHARLAPACFGLLQGPAPAPPRPLTTSHSATSGLRPYSHEGGGYGCFISYSHAFGACARAMQELLSHIKPSLRVFLDVGGGLRAGTSWQQEIYNAMDGPKPMVTLALVTPPWIASSVCREELALGLLHATEGTGTLCMYPVMPVPQDLRASAPGAHGAYHGVTGAVGDASLPPAWATSKLTWFEAADAVVKEVERARSRSQKPTVHAVKKTADSVHRFAVDALSMPALRTGPAAPRALPTGVKNLAQVLLVHSDADSAFASEVGAAVSTALKTRRALGALRRVTQAVGIDATGSTVLCVLSPSLADDAAAEQLLQVALMRQRAEGAALLCVRDAAKPLDEDAPRYMRLLPCLSIAKSGRAAADKACVDMDSMANLFADALVAKVLALEQVHEATAAPARNRKTSPSSACFWATDKTVLVCVGDKDPRADSIRAPMSGNAGHNR